MRFISTKTHAVNDYIFGIMLIAVPLFYWQDGSAAVIVPMVVGVILLLQSIITDYELSAANLIPMKVHLSMDAIAGLVLAASPWIFGFAERVWAPHLIVGLIEIGLALTTQVHRTEASQYPHPPHRSASTSGTQ